MTHGVTQKLSFLLFVLLQRFAIALISLITPINIPKQKLIGVFDLDSLVVEGFNEEDKKYLEQIAQAIAAGCDWDNVI